ncbi:uncharacterized protein [Ptychodera flava]|uniref:uncharacterized protein n=1 Tax=Ptychodera flava TaxID=63121 RepID=UPI00396A5739
MECKSLALLFLTALVVIAAANAKASKKRQLTTDPECPHALYPIMCADRQACIQESQVCDGVKTCMDNSDEENCGEDGDDGEGDEGADEDDGDEGDDENGEDEEGD